MSLERTLRRFLGAPTKEEGETTETLGLPAEEYSMVYIMPVHQDEIEAYRQLVNNENDTEMFGREILERVAENSHYAHIADDHKEMVAKVEEILDTWEPPSGIEETIAFVPTGSARHISGFYYYCKARHQHERDPFEFPEDTSIAASFSHRVRSTVDAGHYVMVAAPERYIPDV
jgi:hypothetical protein